MNKLVFLIFGSATMLAGCTSASVPDNAAKLAVSFDFTAANRCKSTSPAIRVSGTPASAANYRVKMVDRDEPSYNHGGGTVPATGGDIEAGALKSFTGPCPPSGKHTYEITVLALDAGGKVVAAGSAARAF